MFEYVCRCGCTIGVFSDKATCTCKCGRLMNLRDTEYVSMRHAKGINQTEAAKALNIHKSYLSKIEHGIVLPRSALLDKMQKLYCKVEQV